MSMFRRVKRNVIRNLGYRVSPGYLARCLTGMTRGLRALTRAGVQGGDDTVRQQSAVVAPGEAAE